MKLFLTPGRAVTPWPATSVFPARETSGAAAFDTRFEALDTWRCEVASLADILRRMAATR